MSGTCSASLTARARPRARCSARRQAVEDLAPPIALGAARPARRRSGSCTARRRRPPRPARGTARGRTAACRPRGRRSWTRTGTDNRRGWGDNARMAPPSSRRAVAGEDRADLLRRQHLPARAARARARRDRARARAPAVRAPRCSCSTTARATARRRRHASTRRSTRRSRCAQRRGKALNDSELLRRARGRYALLLNEDSELLPGRDARAVAGARRSARARPAPARGCCARTGARRRRAWRFPDAR